MASCTPAVNTFSVGGVAQQSGVIDITTTQYRGELNSGMFDPVRTTTHRTEQLCILDVNARRISDGFPSVALTVDTDAGTSSISFLNDALRARSEPHRIALSMRRPDVGSPTDRIVTWNATDHTAESRHEFNNGTPGFWRVSRQTAILVDGDGMTVVPLEGDRPTNTFAQALSASLMFQTVEHGSVFNVADSHFYRTNPVLQATSLPKPLAGSGIGMGDVHSLRAR